MLRACLRGANATARVSLLRSRGLTLACCHSVTQSLLQGATVNLLVRAVNSSVLSSAVFDAMQLVVDAVRTAQHANVSRVSSGDRWIMAF